MKTGGDMSRFHSGAAPYEAIRDGDRIVVENAYTRWVHDLARGGELTEAVVRFGSNANLLVAPQRTSVAIREGGSYHPYASHRLPAVSAELAESEEGPVLTLGQKLADAEGRVLDGVSVRHTVTYRPWGYGRHVVELAIADKVAEVGQVQVGTFFVTPAADRCAVRQATALDANAAGANGVRAWLPLSGGRRREDFPVLTTRYLPLSVLMFERGLEGIEYGLGDDLGAWDGVGRDRPGWQQLHITYSTELNGYEVRFCPLDANVAGQFLAGPYRFEFRMALPHVRDRIVPLRPCVGGIFRHGRGFEGRWPTGEDISRWNEAGCTLMRLHNDGDSFGNGIFWRDAAYPPYPPAEMAKMDGFLKAANDAGISVAPYFSGKEYHPEAEGFARHAETWMRLVEPGGAILHNYTRHGEFGAQMCLESGWYEKRRATIDEVLRRHAFRAVYYDWCMGYECCHPGHVAGGRRHWDQDRLQDLLEWSHERVGPAGDVYLHLTRCPNLAAENLASLVLTEELGYGLIGPEMFTPHVHFMNIAPRQICDMLRGKVSEADRRRLALCALLHHAGISSTAPVYTDFYRNEARFDVSAYRRHAAPGEGKCAANREAVGVSAYWNERETLVLVANLAEEPVEAEWHVDGEALGPDCGSQGGPAGRVTLGPLELKAMRVPNGSG
ncbi:MAG: hypothetical protein JXR37_15610 [Kiritimatiellae bacterium]|nr:hypothetical protein [Kiritimatiellia bacterium]